MLKLLTSTGNARGPKEMFTRRCVLFLSLSYVLSVDSDDSQHGTRQKRSFIFPPQSIMQLASAIITPAQVKDRIITTNMGIMLNIDLPTNTSQWYPYSPDYRRRKRRAEQDSWAFYRFIEAILTISGMDGPACLRKSICQLREIPVEGDDLPHRILKLVLGHEHTNGLVVEPRRDNVTCETTYPSCPVTPLDLISEVFE